MALTPSQIICGKIAGVIGLLQGLIWAALSLTAIIVYYVNNVDTTSNTNNYSTLISTGIYILYLDKEDTATFERIIRSKDFIVLMWFYFFISVAWLTVSADQLFSIRFNKPRQSKLMVLWGTTTILLSLIDLILTSLLLKDFLNCDAPNTISVESSILCHTVVGIVMTLAARGFILWLVNVTIAIVQIIIGVKIMTYEKIKASTRKIAIPRAKIPPNHFNSLEIQPRFQPFNQPSPMATMMSNQNRNEYPSFMRNESTFAY